jgi:phage terminase large subunit
VEKKVYQDPDKMLSFDGELKELPELRSELCRMPIKPNGNGRFELYTKEEMKNKFKFKSPNLADAVMMLMRPVQIYTQRQVVMPQPIKVMGQRRPWH